MRRIPFAQIITHEGHFPFKDWSKRSDEQKSLPASFIPSLDARNDAQEWARYKFSEEELEELDAEVPFARSDLGAPLADHGAPLADHGEYVPSDADVVLHYEENAPDLQTAHSSSRDLQICSLWPIGPGADPVGLWSDPVGPWADPAGPWSHLAEPWSNPSRPWSDHAEPWWDVARSRADLPRSRIGPWLG